jgi:sec-independent protein translocase protein TatA
MGPLGMPELLIIALIIIILFGSRRIPEVAKGLGEGIRHFKAGIKGDDRELTDRKYRDDDRKYRDDDRRYRDDDRRYRDEREPREEPRSV